MGVPRDVGVAEQRRKPGKLGEGVFRARDPQGQREETGGAGNSGVRMDGELDGVRGFSP